MTAAGWIRRRLGAAPPHLVDAMVAALPEGDVPLPDALAAAALRLYGEVAGGRGTRADAVPLLAADALFTHAFQAQAELRPDAIGAFAERWGARGRLGEIDA